MERMNTRTQLDQLLRHGQGHQAPSTPKDLASVARLLQAAARSGVEIDSELLTAAASSWSTIETDDSRLLNAAANAWRFAAAALASTERPGMRASDLLGTPLHLPVLVAIASSNDNAADEAEAGSGSGMQDLIQLVVSNQIHPSVPLDYLVRAVDLISKHPTSASHALELWPFALNLLRHASLKSIRTTLLAASLRLIPCSVDPIQFILDNSLGSPVSTRLYLLATALSSSSSCSSSSPLLAPTLQLAPTLLSDPLTGPAAAAYLVAHHASTYPPTLPTSSSATVNTDLEHWLASWLLASSLPLYPRLVASPLLARFPAARKLAPWLITSLVALDPSQYVPAAVAATQALGLDMARTGLMRLAHVHAITDTRQYAAEIDSPGVVPLAWIGEPGVGPKPAYPWVLAGLRPGAGKCDVERSLACVENQLVNQNQVALRRAVLRAMASPFAGLRTLATRVRLESGWSSCEARAVWDEARSMLASRVPAARDGAARYLAVVCRDHAEYAEEAIKLVKGGEMRVADVVDMNARLQLAADLRDVCGIEVTVDAWSWDVMIGWVEQLVIKVGDLVSAVTSVDLDDDDQADEENDDNAQEANSDGSDAKHLLVTAWHTLVLVSSRLVTLALSQPADKNTQSLFPILAQTICTLRHAGAVQYVTRELVRLFRGVPALQPTWRAWVWTMLSTPTSSSSSSTRLDTRYSGPRLVLRLVLDPSHPSWLDPLFSYQIAPHTALLLANGLLQDTSLGPKLVQAYASRVLDLALRHASDADASVRSAAIKLVVNWSHRMLVLPNRSAAELFAQRPKEARVLTRVLSMQTQEPVKMGAVVGVLMVLGQVALGATPVMVPGVDVGLLVDTWLAHPIAHVRKLAGVAVARMATSVAEVRDAAERVVGQVLHGNGQAGQNRIHGVLVLMGEMVEAKVVSAQWVRDEVEQATVWMCPVNELVRRQLLARVSGNELESHVIESDITVDDKARVEPPISSTTPLPIVLDLALHADPALRLAAATATMHLHSFRIPLAPYITAWFVLRAMSHAQLVALAVRAIFPVANGTDPSLVSLVKSRMIAPTRGEGREWEDPVVTLVLVHLAGQRSQGPTESDNKSVAEDVCERFEREWAELALSSMNVANDDGLQLQLAFHPAVWTRLVQYRVVCALIGREMRVKLDEAVQVLEAVERVCCESVAAVEQRTE
ncbi:hypothetical protein BCR44DRAFT_80778 [Catenaria anguillulae PL171]|uniref:Uncharacterized protein n=1 Tax=Catenaria anguillulae PL171 TaxID=765915 RepID=A0A1Y2I4N4_9FUNG|nr:hypothetical protein BCR44DRAFT_80778 [Catenaria anguillulae PL171]